MSACATAPVETLNLKSASDTAPVMPPPISLTERAAAQVQKIIDEQRQAGLISPEEKVYLRLSVKGGGCSGFQNKLDLDPGYNAKTDQVFTQHDVEFLVDRKSLLYVSGAVIDFHNELNRSGFSVSNPNAKTTCGCGSSYSV